MSFRAFTYWLFAFLAFIVGLVIWRNDILVQRPYWNAALGVYVQASALAYGDVSSSATPAPAMYENSFVPAMLAGLMRIMPLGNPVTVTMRIIIFAFTSLALLSIVGWMRREVGWGGAVLTAAAILTTPVFAVQVEQLGLEMIATCLVILATICLFRGRDFASALLGALAFFAKWVGGIYLVAAVIYLVARTVTFGKREPSRSRGIIAHLAGVVLAGLVLYFRSIPGFEWGGWVPGWAFGTSSIVDIWMWAPDLLVLTAVTIILVVALAKPVAEQVDAPGSDSADPASPEVRLSPETNPRTGITFWDPPLAFGAIFVVALVTLLSVVGAVPASLAMLVPFIVMALAWTVLSYPRWRAIGLTLLFLVVGFNLVNSTGMFLPEIPAPQVYDFRTGAIRERSREYLADDHALNIDIVRVLIAEARGMTIAAPDPFVAFLSLPALGYVKEPFSGYSLGGMKTKTFVPIEQIREEDPAEIVVVAVTNRYGQRHEWVVPYPQRGDKILFPFSKDLLESDAFKKSPVFVYLPRTVPSEEESLTKQRYLRRFWPSEELLPRAMRLMEVGQLKESEILLRQLLQGNPENSTARYYLGVLLERQDRSDAAIAEYAKVTVGSPEYWLALKASGTIKTAKQQFQQADEDFAAGVLAYRRQADKDPRNLSALFVAWALNDIQRQDWDGAVNKLRQAVEADPEYSVPYRELGFIAQKIGHFEESRMQLERALDLNADDSLTHLYMAGAAAGVKDWDRSQTEFIEVLRSDPDNIEAQNGLGTVLTKLGRNDEAIQEFNDAIARVTDPVGKADLLCGLADAQQAKGDWQASINSLRRALEADAHSETALNSLAWTLSTAPGPAWRSGVEAVELAERLVDRKQVPSPYFDTLAAAYAEAGEWDKAVDAAQRAVDTAREEQNEDLVKDFASRLILYRKREPYRQPDASADQTTQN